MATVPVASRMNPAKAIMVVLGLLVMASAFPLILFSVLRGIPLETWELVDVSMAVLMGAVIVYAGVRYDNFRSVPPAVAGALVAASCLRTILELITGI